MEKESYNGIRNLRKKWIRLNWCLKKREYRRWKRKNKKRIRWKNIGIRTIRIGRINKSIWLIVIKGIYSLILFQRTYFK